MRACCVYFKRIEGGERRRWKRYARFRRVGPNDDFLQVWKLGGVDKSLYG